MNELKMSLHYIAGCELKHAETEWEVSWASSVISNRCCPKIIIVISKSNLLLTMAIVCLYYKTVLLVSIVFTSRQTLNQQEKLAVL